MSSTTTSLPRRGFVRAVFAGSAAVAVARPTAAAAATTSAGAAPIQTVRSSGDIVLAATSGWVEVDAAGNSAARPLDIVIPGVVAGDWVRLSMNGLTGNEAAAAGFTFFTVVAGVAVNGLLGASAVGSWNAGPSMWNTPGGALSYQLKPNDVEGGTARFRLCYMSGGPKTLYATAATWPLVLEGAGPFR